MTDGAAVAQASGDVIVSTMPSLLEINPDLECDRYRKEFERAGRVQIPNVLTSGSAVRLRDLLQHGTPWLVSWCTSATGARYIGPDRLAAMGREEMAEIERTIAEAGRGADFCYIYMSYPLDIAFAQKWSPGSAHEQLRTELRSEPFAELLRDVTGFGEIVGADGYATHFAPGHFLTMHTDEGSKWRRVVAYVLNLTFSEWHPDYGGYLTFFDEKGDVESAFMPRFNSLNLFTVPRIHSVTRVAPYAPNGRAAISGWARETLDPPAQ